jgi:hypothetical protein
MRSIRKYSRPLRLAAAAATFLASVLWMPLSALAATKQEVFDTIHTKRASLPRVDRDSDNQELLKFLKTIPEIADAGIAESSSTVWAKFTDGEIVLFLHNLEIQGQPPPAAARVVPGSEAGAIIHARQIVAPRLLNTVYTVPGPSFAVGVPDSANYFELPSNNQVRLLMHIDLRKRGIGQSLFHMLVGSLLAQQYRPIETPGPTVEQLTTVGGDGVFYFGTHAGVGSPEGVDLPVLLTDDLWDDNKYKTERKAGLLTDGDLEDGYDFASGKMKYVIYFAITPSFVMKYWTFASNSLVYISGCDSDSPRFQSMKNAILKRGASLYVGWTDETNYIKAANTDAFVFDRLLGANNDEFKEADGYGQRPFEYLSVKEDLGFHSLGQSGNSVLTFTPNSQAQSTFGLLAPSIAFVDVDQRKNQLLITGIFGSDPGPSGKVTVGGQTLEIDDWQPDIIFCKNKSSADSPAGDVVVTVREHTSNPARLTDWRGKFRFTVKGQGTLQQLVVFDVHFRADIRKWRNKIHQPPNDDYHPNGFFVDDSGATHECSGSATWPDRSTTSWTGSGSLPYSRKGSAPDVFSGSIKVVSSQQIRIGFVTNSPAGSHVTFVGGSPLTESLSGSYTQPVLSPPTPPFFPLVNLALDEGAKIQKDKLEVDGPVPLLAIYMSPVMGHYTFEWDVIPATSHTAPDPNSPR